MHPLGAETPKNAIKKNGVGGAFSHLFDFSHHYPRAPQHAKKWPRGWEWAHLDAKINAKPWVKKPMGRALADVLWRAYKFMA